jgi:hypothetical protein
VPALAKRRGAAPALRQISLPFAIWQNATSRLTEIHWTGTAALHFE